MNKLPALSPGATYEIVTRIGAQRYNRRSVMRYLGEGRGELLFSARPIAGTQTLHRDHIIGIREVPARTRCYLNARA
jgi:hypothetical protein